jgi:antitoxin component YwqK of YwqJK toxin-antitoxin module
MTSVAIVKFQLRRDTFVNWEKSNIPLFEGEPGFDTTNNILKIGPSGGALWNDIPELTTSMPIATIRSVGGVIPDGSTIKVNNEGVISVGRAPAPIIPIASTTSLGVVRPDGNTVLINSDGIIRAANATLNKAGIVRPDGTTLTISNSGLLEVLPQPIPMATDITPGIVQLDGTTISVNEYGTISSTSLKATNTKPGIVKPDGITTTVDGNGTISSVIPVANDIEVGLVKPDGITTTVDDNGTISSIIPVATDITLGLVKPDGITTTVDENGTISSIATVPKSKLFLMRALTDYSEVFPTDMLPIDYNRLRLTVMSSNDVKITGVDTLDISNNSVVGTESTIRINVSNHDRIKVTCFLTFEGNTDRIPLNIPGEFNRGYLYWKSDDNKESSLRSVDIQDWNTSKSADFRYPVSYTWILEKGMDFTISSEYVELWASASDNYTLKLFFDYRDGNSDQRILVEYM